MKKQATGPWFVETPKDQRELLNDLIENINRCLEELTMPTQSNVAIYVVLDKYASASSVKTDRIIIQPMVLAELKNSFLEAGWHKVETFDYNNHGLGFEIVNQFMVDKPLLHFYLVQQDARGDIKPFVKLKEPPKIAASPKAGEIPENSFG